MRVQKKQRIQLPLLDLLLDLPDLAPVPLRLQPVVGGRIRHGGRHSQLSDAAEAAYIRRNGQRRRPRHRAQELPPVCHDASSPSGWKAIYSNASSQERLTAESVENAEKTFRCEPSGSLGDLCRQGSLRLLALYTTTTYDNTLLVLPE